ncbi:MAG: heme o synthase [Bacteroidota bacterium]
MKPKVNIAGDIVIERSRVLDYLTLMKPELTLLSVATAMAGFYLATEGQINYLLMLNVFLGTALVGGGAGALNQYIERGYDAMMRRTENRPLPSGRLAPSEVLVFGILCSIAGLVVLTALVNPLTGFLAAVTSVSYLFLYTPLKRITSLSTVVGGIPGALPPMMGWTAVRNEISTEAWILFAILFLWQMPHFLSLAWMYKKDYERAGFPMLTVLDTNGESTSRQILLYCVALIPATVLPTLVGLTGIVYLIGGAILGIAFAVCGIFLYRNRTNVWARRVFFASLLYLPILFVIMGLDKL